MKQKLGDKKNNNNRFKSVTSRVEIQKLNSTSNDSNIPVQYNQIVSEIQNLNSTPNDFDIPVQYT